MTNIEGDANGLTVTESVDLLEQEDAIRRKPPACRDGSNVLLVLKEMASEKGLTEEQIARLVRVAWSKKYIDSVVNQIIKCLIPRDGVPADCIVDLISKMCAKVIPVNLEISFLKWLILIYEWIDDKEKFHCLYGMIFLFLDSDALSPYVCHLLYSMTRKEDVRPFRIRKLLDLLRKVGQQPHLIGLLSLYKVHAPHLVSVNIPKMKKAFFKRKDAKWLDIIWSVKSSRAGNENLSAMDKNVILDLPVAKRRRKDVIIPSSYSHGVDVISDGMQDMRIKFDQIATFKDFLTHIDKLEFPSQMGCILESSHLQHTMVCRQDEPAALRLDFWLHQALYEELVTAPSGVTRERVSKFLEALLNFVSFYQKPLQALESCLAQYLLTWNGVDYQAMIFMLVSHLKIQPFHKLNDLVLEPLRKLFFSSPVEFKCQVLTCFTELLLNNASSILSSSTEEAKTPPVTSSSPLSASDFPKLANETIQTCLVIKELIRFVDRICFVALQLEADHILLQHCVLSFFEQVSLLPQNYPVRFVQIPSPPIVYRLLFATNPVAVSRLCNLIVNYKEAYEFLKPFQLSKIYGDVLADIRQFNMYILDISDTIWRNKAFVDRTKSLCYSIPREATDDLGIPHINDRFSIVNHAAFVYVARKFLLQTQKEDMKLNPSLIKGKTRTVYLAYLKRNNCQGVIRFLNAFIKQKVG